MRRILIAVSLLAFAAAGAVAQKNAHPTDDVFGGWWTLTKGSYVDAKGVRRSAVGLKIPYWVRPVGKTKEAVEELYGRKLNFWDNPSASDSLVTIYNNDDPNNYFGGTLEGPMPSAIDDYTISAAGVGTGVLDRISIGWSIPDRSSVFPVFGFYDTFTAGLGAGTMAFNNVIVDTFGGPWAATDTDLFPVVPGEYMVTFGITISSLGIQFPDSDVHFMNEFRIGSDTGPMNTNWSMFFSGTGVTTGSSTDFFYYDSDLNGIYDETEVDHFGGAPFLSNFAARLDIESDANFTDLPPLDILTVRGTRTTGTVTSVWSSNNGYYVANNSNPGGDQSTAIRLDSTSFAPSDQLLSLVFSVESKSSAPGTTQHINLYNYALGTWMRLKTSQIQQIDTVTQVVVTGNMNQYVDPSSFEMKARLDYRNVANGSYNVSVDQIKWRVSGL